MIVRQKIAKLMSLTLTLCILACMVPIGVAYAAEEIVITSPKAGSFLETGETVIVCVAAASVPTLTANGQEVTQPVARGEGVWEFSWTPDSSGVAALRAANGDGDDEINVFAGMTAAAAVSVSADGSDTLLTSDGLCGTAEAVALEFDLTFASAEESLTVTDLSGELVCSLTAAAIGGLDAVGTHRIKVIFDKTAAKQSIFVGGKQTVQEEMTAADLDALRLSGAAVSNLRMRRTAEPEAAIVSPTENTAVFVGDSIEVKVKTTGLSAGQTVKVVAKDGTAAAAEQVPGSDDEYCAVFASVTEGFSSITAVIEEAGVESSPLTLCLMRDDLLKAWDFNDGAEGAVGNLDAEEKLFWNDDFIYQKGKDGEGLAAYREAPTGGAYQGDGLVVNFKTVPTKGRVTFEYDTLVNGKATIRMRGSAGGYTDLLTLNGVGDIWNDPGAKTISGAYTPGAWQKHRLTFDLDHQTMDLSVDGVLRVEKQKVSQLAATNALALVTWAVNRSNTGGISIYTDNLKVFVSREIGSGDQPGGVTESVSLVSPIADAFLEKGRAVNLKAEADGTDTVDFYVNESRIGSVAVTGGAAVCSWIPNTEGTVSVKAVSGAVSDEIAVEVLTTEEYYDDAFDGPKIIENDNINTWGGLQNFDRYAAGGADGGNYGVMTGAGANKSILFHSDKPMDHGVYIVETNVRFPSGSPASIELGNYCEGLGSNEMFYIGAAGCGYHDGDGVWHAIGNLPENTWVNVKYIENIDEATRAIYIDGTMVYSGPAIQSYHTNFGGFSLSMNKNWSSGDEFHVDNLRISSAAAPLFVRSASMVSSDTIRLFFSKAVSLQNLEGAIRVFRGTAEIPVTVTRGDRYLDLTMEGALQGISSTEYTVSVADTLVAEDGMPLKNAETFTVRSAGQTADVTDALWMADGKQTASLHGAAAGTKIGFTCSVTGTAASVRTLLCVYTKEANGRSALKQSEVQKTSLASGSAMPISAVITLQKAIGTNDYLKVFVLDADTLIPLADPITIEAN